MWVPSIPFHINNWTDNCDQSSVDTSINKQKCAFQEYEYDGRRAGQEILKADRGLRTETKTILLFGMFVCSCCFCFAQYR